MEPLHFRSRIDAWLPLVLFGPIGLACWFIWAEYRIEPSGTLLWAGVSCVAVFALMLWLMLGTSYTITATELVVRSGPVRETIPLAAIRGVRRSSTVLAGPALSMRRLEIEHGKYDTAIISPRDITGFLLLGIRVARPTIRTLILTESPAPLACIA
jgi:Bacterial PH domain